MKSRDFGSDTSDSTQLVLQKLDSQLIISPKKELTNENKRLRSPQTAYTQQENNDPNKSSPEKDSPEKKYSKSTTTNDCKSKRRLFPVSSQSDGSVSNYSSPHSALSLLSINKLEPANELASSKSDSFVFHYPTPHKHTMDTPVEKLIIHNPVESKSNIQALDIKAFERNLKLYGEFPTYRLSEPDQNNAYQFIPNHSPLLKPITPDNSSYSFVIVETIHGIQVRIAKGKHKLLAVSPHVFVLPEKYDSQNPHRILLPFNNTENFWENLNIYNQYVLAAGEISFKNSADLKRKEIKEINPQSGAFFKDEKNLSDQQKQELRDQFENVLKKAGLPVDKIQYDISSKIPLTGIRPG